MEGPAIMFFTFPQGMENNPFLTFEVTYSEKKPQISSGPNDSHMLLYFFFPFSTPVALYILVYMQEKPIN